MANDVTHIAAVTNDLVVVFAAQELKKYLRMMRPHNGDITVSYGQHVKDGFRLGLLSDFGIDDGEAEDIALDDILHIDTDANGGIISGSNPRSVLLAVYRFLRENGCRWLFPGIDGEYIPVKEIESVKYHKIADCRYRGQCNEGCEAQQNMLDTIDFSPKIGLNTYMLEFDIPFYYYDRWYSHWVNKFVHPEPVTKQKVLQWKRQCEVEMQKRGLLFHDMGHGWNCEPFGIDSSNQWDSKGKFNTPLTAENKDFFAQVNGERGYFKNSPIKTQICMSNPKARTILAKGAADYAEAHFNVDFLHVWLADDSKNHCECEKCVVKDTADWYVILLNDIDAEFTRRGIDTRIVFIVYLDTYWPPINERLDNPKRFSLLFAPITRLYTETFEEKANEGAYTPYKRNEFKLPEKIAENLIYLKKWQEIFGGDCLCYDYHFFSAHYKDPGYQAIAKCLWRDIRALGEHSLKGIIEDQSQRNYFPTGFPMVLYGQTLFDNSLPFGEQQEDYFRHAFGVEWNLARDYLNAVSDAFDFRYLNGQLSVSEDDTKRYFNPVHAKSLAQATKIAEDFLPVVTRNIVQPERCASVSWQLLEYHVRFTKLLSEACVQKAQGNDEGAYLIWQGLMDQIAMCEDKQLMQPRLDYCLYYAITNGIFETGSV